MGGGAGKAVSSVTMKNGGNISADSGSMWLEKFHGMYGFYPPYPVAVPDHVHMYVSIPLKESVAKIVGRIKGKSSLMLKGDIIARR